MKTKLFNSALTGAIAFVILLITAAPVSAAEADPAIEKHLKRLLAATGKNDHASFVEDSIPQFKNAPKAALAAASQTVGPRLKKGYETEYLASLKQHGHQVYLWKLTFKDGGDDLLARLVMQNGKVAGFFFQ